MLCASAIAPSFDRMTDRSPHLNDGEAAAEQLVGLLR
jgi:hypothetical protein